MYEKRLYDDLSWLWSLWGNPDPTDNVYDGLSLYLIRENGKLRIESDHHLLGLFPMDVWRTTLRKVGFEVYEDPDPDREGGMTFVCVKP